MWLQPNSPRLGELIVGGLITVVRLQTSCNRGSNEIIHPWPLDILDIWYERESHGEHSVTLIFGPLGCPYLRLNLQVRGHNPLVECLTIPSLLNHGFSGRNEDDP